MFPYDAHVLSPLYHIHRRESVSREDLNLKYHDGHVACTTSITTEICAESMFNENVEEFQDIIVNEVRVLLQHNEEKEDNSVLHINKHCEQHVRRCS